MNAVFDTTLLIDYLNGVPQAAAELEHYDRITISVITWIEVMGGVRVGVRTVADETVAREFLQTFSVHDVDARIAERAANICRSRAIRVPDAIIQATARELGELLVTRNAKDLPSEDPGIRIPYRLKPPKRR